jgi:ATP-dependent helicase/nuclease subunit A
MAWTTSQLEAINWNEGNCLVSAGAGSGKTAVLTARIVRLVHEKRASLSQLLVLTFTNKAAHEMKERVRDAFLEQGETALAEEVERSEIETFDAYALSLVEKYHYALGLSSDLALCDESFLEVEKRKILERMLALRYEEKDPIFLDLVRHYAIENDEAICTLILAINDLADLASDKKEFYATYERRFYNPDALEDGLASFLALMQGKLETALLATKRYENSDFATREGDFLEGLLQARSYNDLSAAVLPVPYPRKKKGEDWSLHDSAIHSACGDIYKEIRKMLGAFGDEANVQSRYLSTKPYAHLLITLSGDLDAELSAFKKEHGVYTFADIAAFARDLAKDPEIGPGLRAHYRFLMIDEYQDTSDLQESFISSLADDNLFAVGDIKQSIYRFRNANPDIFAQKLALYGVEKGGHLISLNTNFRTREEALSDINLYFKFMMSPSLGGVLYDDSQALAYGNKAAFVASSSPAFHSETLFYVKDPAYNRGESEARIIAQSIQEKIQAGYAVVANKKTGALRPATYGDFAILIARKSDFPLYQKVFAAAKIPLEMNSELDVASEDVSLTLLSLIRLVLSLDEDEIVARHAYASVKRSYLYEEKDADLYREIVDRSYLHSELAEKLRAEKGELLGSEVEVAVQRLLDEFPFYAKLPTLGNVKANFEKLASFLSFSRTYDRFGYSLKDFVDYFHDLKKYDVGYSLQAGAEMGEAVHLMSIHASKGLQFPVVYLPDLSAKANLQDVTSSLLASPRYGLLLPLTLDDGEAQNIFHVLSRNEEGLAALSERMRLLYVAMTRVEEKLIFVRRQESDVELVRIDNLHLLRLKPGTDKKTGAPIVKGSLKNPQSFADFLALSAVKGLPEKTVKIVDPQPLSRTSPLYPAEKLELRSLTIPAVVQAPNRASKRDLAAVDEEALAYGTKLHRYLELADFKTKDLSFVADPLDRALLSKVLALPFFAKNDWTKEFHEYAFYDEEANIHGSIDLLLLYSDHLAIIDFKTSETTDPAYVKQLAAYRSYVERVFKKPASTYLLSLRKAEVISLNALE